MKFSSVALVDNVEDDNLMMQGFFFFIKYLKTFFCPI